MKDEPIDTDEDLPRKRRKGPELKTRISWEPAHWKVMDSRTCLSLTLRSGTLGEHLGHASDEQTFGTARMRYHR